jgi:hypothetical protein
VDISRFGMFPVEKVNDYSLLNPHEKWLNSKRAWFSLENAMMLIDRQGGEIRSSGTRADPRREFEWYVSFPLKGMRTGWCHYLLTALCTIPIGGNLTKDTEAPGLSSPLRYRIHCRSAPKITLDSSKEWILGKFSSTSRIFWQKANRAAIYPSFDAWLCTGRRYLKRNPFRIRPTFVRDTRTPK